LQHSVGLDDVFRCGDGVIDYYCVVGQDVLYDDRVGVSGTFTDIKCNKNCAAYPTLQQTGSLSLLVSLMHMQNLPTIHGTREIITKRAVFVIFMNKNKP
jgi:hypothetical protein